MVWEKSYCSCILAVGRGSAMVDIVSEDELSEKKVEIVLKTIGPAPPSRLRVPSSIKVSFNFPNFLF